MPNVLYALSIEACFAFSWSDTEYMYYKIVHNKEAGKELTCETINVIFKRERIKFFFLASLVNQVLTSKLHK